MKKYIIAILLVSVVAIPCYAWMSGMIAGSGAAVSCYGSGSSAGFLWECNSTTVGDTGFSPCGYSAGDTTATAIGSDETITGGECVFNDDTSDGNDHYIFDVSSDDLLDDQVGTIFMRFTITTFDHSTGLFRAYRSGANQIKIQMVTGPHIRLWHEGTGDEETLSTSGTNLSTGTEYILRARWRTANGPPYFSINVYDTSMVEVNTGASSDSDILTEFQFPLIAGDFFVGNREDNQIDGDFKINYIHVYKEWLDSDPN